MAEPNELYQQVILGHNKKPCNFKRLETANRE
jgi:NifU-like protein involved in Fe-S cluster formation